MTISEGRGLQRSDDASLQQDSMLTAREVAAHHGVTKRTVTRWAKRGLLPVKRYGNQYMFEALDVRSFTPPDRNYVKDWGAHLSEVARLHREALDAGISTRTAIAEHFGCPGSGTVDRWLLLARERGYITRESK